LLRRSAVLGRSDIVAETGGYHVVLGATGGAGRTLVAELARQNRRVRAVSRRATEPWPKGVEAVTADILRADEVRKACRDAAVVYHAANVPYSQWQQVLPALTESVIAGASAGYCQLGAEETKLPRAQPSREYTSTHEGNTSRIAPGEEGAITSSSVLTGRETMTVELEVVVDRGVNGEELLRMPS
jgi:NAD(P)-dependent dehydrogenase (short-subunit alcohol dehydrogenase family)